MRSDISESDARFALGSIEHRRQQVLAEIDVPPWYWWLMAVGWLVIGAVGEFANAWASGVATLAFGAAHAIAARRALSGRQRTGQLRVRADVVGRYVPAVVIGFLLAMVTATVAIALLLAADGARHPGVIASAVVAVVVVFAGPNLMAALRRRAQRRDDV